MADTVFAFGKHRGKTFQQVCDHHRDYVAWACKLESTTGQMAAFIDFCRSSGVGNSAPPPSTLRPPPQSAFPNHAPPTSAVMPSFQSPPFGYNQPPHNSTPVFPGATGRRPNPSDAPPTSAAMPPFQSTPPDHAQPPHNSTPVFIPGVTGRRSNRSDASPTKAAMPPFQSTPPDHNQPPHNSTPVFIPGVTGHRSNLSAFAFTVPSPATAPSFASSPSGATFPDVQLCAEVCNATTCKIGCDKYMPRPVWQELSQMQGLKMGDSRRDFFFPLATYQSVMDSIQANLVLQSCQIEGVPKWVMAALAAGHKQGDESANDEADKRLNAYLAAVPPELQEDRPIMQFQKEGIRFGLRCGGKCLLGDEMGLGKTLQALVIAAQYRNEWPVLVVAPSALRLVWREQALMWLPNYVMPAQIQVLTKHKDKLSSEAQMVIISYDLLGRNEGFHVAPNGQQYKVVIVDESHYIKSAAAKRTEAVLKIARAAARCVLISGTPAVNRAEDLFTQLQALMPKQIPRNKNEFCKRYCQKKEMHIPGRGPIVKWDGARHKAELYTLLSQTIMIRRLKKDVLTQLPAKRRQRITLASAKLDQAKMAEVARCVQERAFSAEEEGNGQGPSVAMTECFKLTAEAKIDGVSDYVDYLLSNNLKFLIFAHHHVMLDAIEKKVSSAGVGYIRIDGKTSADARQASVTRFQTEEAVRVAVLGITACGQGLTLTAAHTVVFAELYWVPGQMLQAEDRVHRIGQQEMVDVHYCIADGSLDGIMFNSLNKKSKNTTAVTDGKEKHMDCYHQVDAPKVKAQLPGPGVGDGCETSGAKISGGVSDGSRAATAKMSPKKRGRPSGLGGQAAPVGSPKKRGRPSKTSGTGLATGTAPTEYGLAKFFN